MPYKKILLIGSAYPFRGGLATYNERLAFEFSKQGHQIEIWTFTLQYPNFLFPGKTQYSTMPAPENIIIKRKVNSINPFNWIKIGREIKKLKPDILLYKFWLPFMGPCFGTIARIAKSNKHTKVVCILDNIIPHEKRIGDIPLTRYFINSVDAFIAMSQSVMDDLNFFDTQKPRLLSPHPLFDNFGKAISKYEACQKLGIDVQTNYLLFFGFIREYKGLDLLLEAFNDKYFKEHNIKLIIAGEFYCDEKPYLELINKFDLNQQVILKTDFVPDNEVVNYFCAADMVVQPYKHATQSGVTQIAYHFEKPMLVTNVGGLPELVPHEKAGYVVNPSANEIRKALIDFYQNKKADILVKGIKEEKKRFAWNVMTDKVIAISEF
jgi:glycosyltransferase involved in cell wall biosynthesis